MRKCSNCNTEKSQDDFYLKGKRIDSACKECRRNQRNARYQVQTQRPSSDDLVVSSDVAKSHPSPSNVAAPPAKTGLLSAEMIAEIAAAFLLLETWQADLDTQQEISNSK